MNIYRFILFTFFFCLSLFFVYQPAQAAPLNKYNGVTLVPRNSTDPSSEEWKQTLRNLKTNGVNLVTYVLLYRQGDVLGTNIYESSNNPTDQSLAESIQYAHSLGLKVQLKPHVDNDDSPLHWRGDINPADKAAWFANYSAILMHIAQIAKDNGAEEICIGTELFDLSTNSANLDYWKSLISQIRTNYPGTLTYSALFYNEPQLVPFWSDLDYIGISAYWSLASSKDPTVDELKNSWSNINASIIQPLATKNNKPIVFTEIGYRSMDCAAVYPWGDYYCGAGTNMSEQANAFEAYLSYWNNQPNMKGSIIWGWEPNPVWGGINDNWFSPQNKPAQQVIAKWFGGTTSNYIDTVQNIPGRIEFENFDSGNYFDTDSENLGHSYRPSEGVDISPTSDTEGGYTVGWVKPGEWLGYKVKVNKTDTYDINIRAVSAVKGGTFHIEVDGVKVTPSLEIPNTGAWNAWSTMTYKSVHVDAGDHLVKVVMDSGGGIGWVGDFNYFEFVPSNPVPEFLKSAVYDNKYQMDWVNWSWDANVAETNDPLQSTNKVLSLTTTKPWAGLRLHSFIGLSDSGYDSLNLAVYKTDLNQQYQLWLVDSDGKELTRLALANYGTASVKDWTAYSIPLKDLGAEGRIIKDIILQDISGKETSVTYLDNIEFKQTSTPSPVPSPSITPSASPSPSSTSTPVPNTLITASPNPCILNAEGLCTSHIQLNAKSYSNLEIKVREANNAPFTVNPGTDPNGGWDASWITAKGYTFDLYSNSVLIASVFVKGVVSPSLTPAPSSSPTVSATIYDDGIGPVWTNWSWDSVIDFANTTNVFKDAQAILFKTTAAWGGLRFHNDSGIDTSPYTQLEFSAKADSDNKPYGISIYDKDGKQLGQLNLTNYGGTPLADAFKTYSIPLSDFGPKGIIKDIIIQDWTGKADSALYLDEIVLK